MEDISILKGEKFHECNQCRQSFTHMVHSNHGDVKSYDSNQCRQNFNESEYLNKHMLPQSGKKLLYVNNLDTTTILYLET